MPKNRVFGLLRKIESLLFARNDLKWSVLWLANFLRKFHIWENSYSRDLCAKALDQSDRSIFQITISFEPFNCFLYIFFIKIEYHKTFKTMLSFFCKNAVLPWKRVKRSKSGRSSWTKSTFLYIAPYWLIRFFWYFGWKILILQILAIFGLLWLKIRLSCILLNIGTLDFFMSFLFCFLFQKFRGSFFYACCYWLLEHRQRN